MDNILLLEANTEHAAAIKKQLQLHQYRVQVSAEIVQAEQLLQKIIPDMLIIDLNVHSEEFNRFYESLRIDPQWEGIPRLFIAGKENEAISRQLRDRFDETVLSKPLDIQSFIRLIKTKTVSEIPPKKEPESDYLSSFIGKKLGNVLILEEIDRGGMGAVFLGYQESLDRQVAVKVMLPQMAEDPQVISRFQREAKSIAKLKSQNIVQIYDFALKENRIFYIIMEYLPGITINALIKRMGVVSPSNAISIVIQVAKGLAHAHAADLIHRDIKPSNLIVDYEGNVTITDFGLVKPQKKVTHTQTNVMFGTPQYISPEQISGMELDHRADIYALGIVFYQLLYGNPPFNSEFPVELFMKHVKETIKKPKDPDVPDAVFEVIQKMTEKDRNLRYRDCHDLVKALDSLDLKAEPINIESGSSNSVKPLTEVIQTGDLDTEIERRYALLKKYFPTLISIEKLEGSMVLSETGQIITRKGSVPDQYLDFIFILNESVKQLLPVLDIGEWQFTLTAAPERILSIFPQEGGQLSLLLFEQIEQSFSTASFQTRAFDLANPAEQTSDPYQKITSISGVSSVYHFNKEGRLINSAETEGNARAKVTALNRIGPVSIIIESIQVKFTELDIWFESGRLFIWKIDSGILFIKTTLDISKSFLSLFILTHLPQLNSPAPGDTEDSKKNEKVQTVVGTVVSRELLLKIQHKLAERLGPISKILINREIKEMGYSPASFPDEQVLKLAERLAKPIDSDQQRGFLDDVQDLLFEFRSSSS